MSHRRNTRLATIPGVKEDAAQILEKFLQSKRAVQQKRAVGQSQPGYQRVAKLELVEDDPRKSYFRSDSYRMASVDSILGESIDSQAEEFQAAPRRPNKDNFRKKTNSLPSSYKTKIIRDPIQEDDIPHSPSKKLVPRNYFEKRLKAGSVSSSDDSDGSVKEGRKKKSLFKRTKERLIHAFKMQSDNERRDRKDTNDSVKDVSKSKSKPKKTSKKKDKSPKGKNKNGNSPTNDNDVFAEVHTHTVTHIHQEIKTENGGVAIVLRTEDTTEEVEIVDDKAVVRRFKKHLSVKESDRASGGVLSKVLLPIRRSFSRMKNGSVSISESKSAELNSPNRDKGKAFKRTVSEPSDEVQSCSQPNSDYVYRERKTSSGDKKKVTEIFSELMSRDLPKDYTSDQDIIDSPTSKNGQESMDVDRYSDIRFIDDPAVGTGHRENLELGGLIKNKPRVPEACRSFDLDYECEETDEIVKTPSGDFRKNSHIKQNQYLTLPSDVQEDGHDNIDAPRGGSDVPLDEKSEQEKDELFGVIARKLAHIADNYVEKVESENGMSDLDSPKGDLSSIEQQILACLRKKGDQINEDMTFNTASPAMQMVKHATYGAFQKTVQKTIGNDVGWSQLAILFYLSRTAVGMAGAGGALAVQIKENTLRYFEDKFASWIVGQGGWDSMLEETDSELD